MSSSDSWTLIGLTILVVLLLFYLSKKMICGSNGNSGDSGGGGGGERIGRYSNTTGHNHQHQQNHPYHQEYFEEDMSHPDAYHHSCYPEYNNPDPDNPHHQDQNSEHRLNLDYNSNQQIGEDVIMNRPYYYHPHHHYHNLPHYPSQSVSLRELLEICSRGGSTGSSSVANNQPHTFPQTNTAAATTTTTTTATALPGNYRTNTSPDNQLCHDTSLDTNNVAASDSGLVEVSVISDPTSSSTPPYQANSEPISTTNSSATIELTERKKQLIEKQLRTQIVRMIQAEREVRRLAHLLSLQQGFAESGSNVAAVPASSTPDYSTVDGEHEPYYISNERGSSPNNSLLHSHHPNYSGHNEVILSAHALSSRYPSHLIRGRRSDHHQHNHHLYEQHPRVTLAQDANSPSSRRDSEESHHHEMPPPPYEDCVASSPS